MIVEIPPNLSSAKKKIVTNPGALHDLFIFGLSPDVFRVGAGKVTQGDIRIVIWRCLLAKLNGS